MLFMLQWAKDVVRRRELVWILIERNLKIRYKNSFLGFFWSLLGPIFLILIYSVFLGLLRVPIHLPTLVSGIIAWQFLAMCMGDSLHSIVGNANLVTKASFPRVILPLSMVGANAINFLFSFGVLSVYLLAAGADFGALYWLPGILLTHAALCLGMALMLGAANVFFRDTEHVLSVVMLAWFFLSPVIYEPQLVVDAFPPWVQVAFFANPMSGILTAYRAALLSQPTPDARLLALSFGVAWAVFAAGLLVFRKVEPRFGDEL
jgi:lipopolysaccharide transport system permease protein